MLRFSRIPRLPERMATLTFLGSFPDTAQLLMPVPCGQQWDLVAGWSGGHGERAPTHLSSIPPATECHHCSLHVHQVI